MIDNEARAPAATLPGRNHVPGIDGLRAVAVLAVMIYHLMPKALPGGFVGVDVFFVISGYVVTGSLMREADRRFRSVLAGFYARRFRRILPALLVSLCATVAASIAFVPETWLSSSLRTTALHAFFGVSNFALIDPGDRYFGPRTEFNPFTHTWSLAVEEQFYLVFPLLLYGWAHGTRRSAATAARYAFVVLCVASLVWCAWATEALPNHAYYMLAARFWEFAVGAAACMAGSGRRAGAMARLDSLTNRSL